MLRILFVEDQEDTIRPVINLLEAQSTKFNSKVVGFDDAERSLMEFSPDVVILDLLQPGLSGELIYAGDKTLDFIWKQRFCPIVVFSAQPEHVNEERSKHPFIKCVKKGRNGPRLVHEALNEVGPHVRAIQKAESYVRDQFALAMRDVAPRAFQDFKDPKRRLDAVIRGGRRRLAALMDEYSDQTGELAPWEQYLNPPINSSFQLGDVLRLTSSKYQDESAYRLVLTPSCDLVKTATRLPKVNFVLVAKCCSIADGLKKTSLKKTSVDFTINKSKLKKLIKSELTQGFIQSILPLPHLAEVVPSMSANMKELELIGIDEISDDEEKKYTRVASLDSPFRELVAWVYMQTACRPGLPDRDYNLWANEIVKMIKD